MLLFLCSDEGDYLQGLTYSGLAAILGKEKIHDFPRQWAFHRERKHFFSTKNEYPLNLGFASGGHPSVRPFKVSSLSLQEVAANLEKNFYDLVVLAAAKSDALQVFTQLFDRIRVPWVFVDGGDWREIGGDFKRTGGDVSLRLFQGLCQKSKPALIFKRELALNAFNSSETTILPFPFSFKSALIPPLSGDQSGGSVLINKKHEVLFWAVESSQTRKRAFEILKGKYDCDRNGSVPGQKFRKYGLRGQKYFEALGSAKMALSFRGEGFDTLRFWEIPASGACLLSETPDIQIPDPFKDGETAAFVKPDLSDLTEKIDYYLAHDKEREEIAQRGHAHLRAHHTHLQRAEFFLENVKARLGLDFRR